MSVMAAVLVLCSGGPDCNSKNLSPPKATFQDDFGGSSFSSSGKDLCMDGSGLCLVRQSQSIPSALLQSQRFTGLQADDPIVVLKKASTFPIARADGILWAT